MNKAISFVREAYMELKKVNWPSKKQTINYTLIVIGSSIAVAIFLGILDMLFSAVIGKFLF